LLVASGLIAMILVQQGERTTMKLNRFYPHNWLDSFRAAAHAGYAMTSSFSAGGGRRSQIQRGGLGCRVTASWGLAGEMGLALGMTPREILKAATIDGARIIGFDQDLGSIEVGKLAELSVLDRNPLENIRNSNSIRYVMKNGELYEAETLTQVWPVRKELPRLWWWNEGPRKQVTSQQPDK
jgi:hypothetical protein